MNRRAFLQAGVGVAAASFGVGTAGVLAAESKIAATGGGALPSQPPLRPWAADSEAAFQARSQAFLRYVVDHQDNPRLSEWGPYRCFDGYTLAALALGAPGWRKLLADTLDMIEKNLADEAKRPGYKWHLADFALHPLLRARFLYGAKQTAPQDRALWDRFDAIIRRFKFHFGDLSENHNLLHMAGRYFVAKCWPQSRFLDGRSAAQHEAASRLVMHRWMEQWVTKGSTEWGADIYANVNFLALFNLLDFAPDESLRRGAQGVLDLFMVDQAVDAFGGSPLGAARRSYGCYSVDPLQSPARPLHHLYYGTGGQQPFNLNFIGGVIEAATSAYRPPAVITRIVQNPGPTSQISTATHVVGVWSSSLADPPAAATDHLSRTTWRQPEAMLSVMNSFGGRGRYTEQVWQASLGGAALAFSNHPTLRHSSAKPQEILAGYETAAPGKEHPYWVIGNVPPGDPGDIRPGFWQGNTWGPRSFGAGPLAFIIHHIDPKDPLPWAHVFLPRRSFDEVVEQEAWLFGRKGEGYLALWLPTSHRWIDRGVWKEIELRLETATSAVLAMVGGKSTHKSFDEFTQSAVKLSPAWDEKRLALSAKTGDGDAIEVEYASGARRNGQPVSTRGDRFNTRWGRMPLGERRIELACDDQREVIDLGFLAELAAQG